MKDLQHKDARFKKQLHGNHPSHFLNDNVDKKRSKPCLKLCHYQAEAEGSLWAIQDQVIVAAQVQQ